MYTLLSYISNLCTNYIGLEHIYRAKIQIFYIYTAKLFRGITKINRFFFTNISNSVFDVLKILTIHKTAKWLKIL